MWWEAEDDGGTSGTRTRDHRIKSAMLLPTELSSHQRSATVAGAWSPSAQRCLAAGPNANDNSLMYSIYGNLQSSREEFLWRIGVAVPGVAGDIWCEVAILWFGPGERPMGAGAFRAAITLSGACSDRESGKGKQHSFFVE